MKERLPFANDFRELLVYKKSMHLAESIQKETKEFPKEEVYSLTNQIRRSSRSIGAQIAEAWGKRAYVKHFTSKLTDAEAELFETEHWIEIAFNCKYISPATLVKLNKQCHDIKNLLGGMIIKASLFCSSDR